MPPPPLTRPSDGNVNRGPGLMTALWVTTVLSSLFVVSRLYVRLGVIKYHGWDDYWIVCSILLGIGGIILDTIAVDHGLGKHEFFLTQKQVIEATKFNFIAIPFNLMSSATAKVSVCFFLLHVNQNKRAAYFLYAVSALLLLFAAATCILLFAQCSPVRALWTPALRHLCLPPNINANVGLAQSIFFCVADVVFAVFPLSFLWKLKMNRRTKMALAGVLSLGLVAAAFGIVRSVDLNEIGSRKDILFSTVDLAIWSFLEQNVTIIAACIPVLYTVFRTILGNRSTAAHYTHRTPSHGNTFDERKKYHYGSGSRAVRGKFVDELDVKMDKRGNMGTGWEGSTRAESGEVDLEDVEAARKEGSEDGILEHGHGLGRGNSHGHGGGGLVCVKGDGGILRTTEVRVTSDDKWAPGPNGDMRDRDAGLTQFRF